MNWDVIDINGWDRKKNFSWFSQFPNPCFGLTSRMDVTEVLAFSEKHQLSSFSVISYIISTVLNDIEDFRYRMLDGNVVLCHHCNIAYTVATGVNAFTNCRTMYVPDFNAFYPAMRDDIEAVKRGDVQTEEFNDVQIVDDYYFSCLRWLDFTGCTEPIPGHIPENYSIPRLCWGKYVHENGRDKMSLSITVNHALVDGYAVAKAFEKIQMAFDAVWEFTKGE